MTGADWYRLSKPAILACGAGDIALGASLLAATSPRCALTDNLRRALRRTSPLSSHQGNISRALSGLPLSGPKVSNFARALAGDTDAITIDIWLARALNINPSMTLSQYLAAERRLRRAARRRNLPPRDYTAQLWCSTVARLTGRSALHYGDALHILTSQQELPL